MEIRRKTALYIRLSLEDEDVDGTGKTESDSVAAQRMILREYARERLLLPEYEIAEYVDDGVSGTHFKRQGFQELLSDMKSGNIGCIIVKDFSRFGRDYLDVGYYMEYIFPLLNIRFISVNDNFDSSENIGMTGGINIALKNLINSMYSRDISKKIMAAIQVRSINGTRIPSKAKYGYFKGKDGKLLIKPEEAAVVKRIFELAMAGVRFMDIARQLNEDEIPSRFVSQKVKSGSANYSEDFDGKSKLWTYESIRDIVRDEIYTGVRIWKRQQINFQTGHHRVQNDESQWVRIEGAHEAIISKTEYELANQNRHKTKYKKRVSKSMAPRLLACGYCGHILWKTGTHGLFCPQSQVSTDEGCQHLLVNQQELETSVTAYVRHFASVLLQREKENYRRQKEKTASEGVLKEEVRTLSAQKLKL